MQQGKKRVTFLHVRFAIRILFTHSIESTLKILFVACVRKLEKGMNELFKEKVKGKVIPSQKKKEKEKRGRWMNIGDGERERNITHSHYTKDFPFIAAFWHLCGLFLTSLCAQKFAVKERTKISEDEDEGGWTESANFFNFIIIFFFFSFVPSSFSSSSFFSMTFRRHWRKEKMGEDWGGGRCSKNGMSSLLHSLMWIEFSITLYYVISSKFFFFASLQTSIDIWRGVSNHSHQSEMGQERRRKKSKMTSFPFTGEGKKVYFTTNEDRLGKERGEKEAKLAFELHEQLLLIFVALQTRRRLFLFFTNAHDAVTWKEKKYTVSFFDFFSLAFSFSLSDLRRRFIKKKSLKFHCFCRLFSLLSSSRNTTKLANNVHDSCLAAFGRNKKKVVCI